MRELTDTWAGHVEPRAAGAVIVAAEVRGRAAGCAVPVSAGNHRVCVDCAVEAAHVVEWHSRWRRRTVGRDHCKYYKQSWKYVHLKLDWVDMSWAEAIR